VPAAAFLVIIERNLQIEDQEVTTRKGHINMVFYLFWLHVYQLLTVLCFFWTDFVPGFGYTDNIYHFWENWWFGVRCFFGGAGCDSKCGVRGTMFVLLYAMSYFGIANLTRFSEGATFVAIVNVSYGCNYIRAWSIEFVGTNTANQTSKSL
ncbi:crt homolog 2-like, partial [Paramuricea clavata]